MFRLLALSCIFFLAMAFSCQDHNIPDPPVTNCKRVDGTQRAFDCEFEFVKAEFYNLDGTKKDIYATVTPSNPNFDIVEPAYASFVYNQRVNVYYEEFPATVTIRRIAPSPTGSNQYILRKNIWTMSPTDPTEGFSDFSYGAPIVDPAPVTIDIPVGGTYTYEVSYGIGGYYEDKPRYLDYKLPGPDLYLFVESVETAKKLKQAPYNYTLYRDLAEGKLLLRPTIIPARCTGLCYLPPKLLSGHV
ncbi:hypothetical protein SAMN04487996_101376 [Dyadobacter soli]|uniref:DUF4249 domain-containing protein n=2 Tax=Dyadobacter soli TaxID=659014 RepID=A0A1G6VYQ7_9BACT|nr:hypothetical protein SAMN04487996_101376 [Dyadobacter soli]